MKGLLQFLWLVAMSAAFAVGLSLIFHGTAQVFAASFAMVFAGYGFVVKLPHKVIEQAMLWFGGE